MTNRQSKAPGKRPDSETLVLISDENKENLHSLAAELRSKTPPPVFAGAGVSARANYPTWRKLVDCLFDRIRVLENEETEEQRSVDGRVDDIMHSPDDLLWTAKACLDLFKIYDRTNEYYDLLETKFAGEKGANAVLDELVKLPFTQFLTTNYDPSIQESYKRVHKKTLKCIDWGLGCDVKALPSTGSSVRSCVHLHGYYANPTKIILNEDDYQARYFQSTPHRVSLEKYLGDNTVVFVGFSLKDLDFMNVLRALKATSREQRRRHYAILPLSDSQHEGYIKSETERLDDKFNIKAIFYRQLTNNYLGLEEAIKLLGLYFRKRAKPGARKPVAPKRTAKAPTFKFDKRVLKKPRFSDDPNKHAFGNLATRNGRRLTAKVARTSSESRWFRIELLVEALRGYPDLPDGGLIYVHPSFAEVEHEGTLDKTHRKITRTFWAYGAFTVGVLVDKKKTALELDLASLKAAPKDFRDR